MEEKLRNLSQNIQNNTGENAHKPEETPPPEEEHQKDAPIEEEQEVSDYTPEPEEHREENEEEHKNDEHKEEHEEEHKEDEEEHHDSEEPEKEHEDSEEEPEEEPHDQEDQEESEEPEEEKESVDVKFTPVKEQEEAEKESAPVAKATILTMNEDDEPKESPTRTKKYSPEVEAALNRLNSNDIAVDLNSEPLSTEPKKKHHIGRIFVCFLLILAIAAVTICVLVEQKIIDNPLNLFSKKETSKVETIEPETPPTAKTSTEPTELVDAALISAVDTIFKKQITTDNYHIFSRTTQTINGKNYIYYDVAETPAVDCGGKEETDCVTAKIDATNYKNYPAYRYTFVGTDFDVYEFESRALLKEAEIIDDVTKNLTTPTSAEEKE